MAAWAKMVSKDRLGLFGAVGAKAIAFFDALVPEHAAYAAMVPLDKAARLGELQPVYSRYRSDVPLSGASWLPAPLDGTYSFLILDPDFIAAGLGQSMQLVVTARVESPLTVPELQDLADLVFASVGNWCVVNKGVGLSFEETPDEFLARMDKTIVEPFRSRELASCLSDVADVDMRLTRTLAEQLLAHPLRERSPYSS